MKIGGASVKGGMQDLYIFIIGKEKQEEIILSNKRRYSVGQSDDPLHHFP